MENFYTVLECTQTATQDEIKMNYHRLVKEYHPDKGALTSEKFLLIDTAYKTLRDRKLRKDYDSSFLAESLNNHSLIYAELSKRDIELDSEGNAYYPCRCGESFVIQKCHLCQEECVIDCSECSNSILIK